MNAVALPGAVTLVGELRLRGTKVPWGDSPERRGGPWAPPPRGVLLKAVLFLLSVILLGFWNSVWGM